MCFHIWVLETVCGNVMKMCGCEVAHFSVFVIPVANKKDTSSNVKSPLSRESPRGVRSIFFHHPRYHLSLEDSDCCWLVVQRLLPVPVWHCVNRPIQAVLREFSAIPFHYSPLLSILHPTDSCYLCHFCYLSSSLSLPFPWWMLVLHWHLLAQSYFLGSTGDMQAQNNSQPFPWKD